MKLTRTRSAALVGGALIAVLENHVLLTDRDKALNRLQAQQADRFQLLLRDPVAAQNLAQDIIRTEAEVKLAEERLARLEDPEFDASP